MKNKRFLISVLAILTVFALIGCPTGGEDSPVVSTTISVTFDSNYNDGAKLTFDLAKNQELGAENYQQVQALETRIDYEFKGWSLSRNGSPETVSAQSKWAVTTTYYGLWDEIVADGQPVTITYNLNSFPSEQPGPYTGAKSGEAIGLAALPVLTPTDPAYLFLGWAKTPEGDTLDQWAIFRSNTILYARWVKNVTITYDLNGFPAVQPPPYVQRGAEIGREALPKLSAAGYYFLGWSEKRNGTPVTEYAVFTNDVTLYARHAPNIGPVPLPPPLQFEMPYDLHPLRADLPDDFIRGADISNCLEIEEHGGVYRDINGRADDIMKILTDAGINWVRIRLWVDPSKDSEHYTGDGNNHLGVAKVIASRAKAAGMKFLLNYHYSDYWADPQNRKIPYIWKDISSRQDLLDALGDYTRETIEELIEAGAEPDMVAIGNEIRQGLLNEHRGGSAGGTGYVLNGWADYSRALRAASTAVREAAPNAKIMIHWDNGGNASTLDGFAQFTRRNGAAPTTNIEVDYDVIGVSWYTIWSSHGNIDSLYDNIRKFRTEFGKEVVVCETGYMWDIGNWDSMGNYAGPDQENGAANALTNTNGFTSDSEVVIATRADGTRYVPSTPENQARVIRATMDAIAAAGGHGIMWWGADWIALPGNSGVRSNSEMATMFESTGNAATNGKILPASLVMGTINGPSSNRKPGKITSLKADPDLFTVNLTWNKVNTAVATAYELQYADSANGTWTTLSNNLTAGSYVDDNTLDLDQTRFYRIRAYNDNGWGNWSDPVETKTLLFIPRGIKITTTINTATLTWTKLTGAIKYEISRATSQDGPWTMCADDVVTETYTDTGVGPNTVYYYKLRGYNTAWGEYSEPVTAGTLPIPAVANFRITAADSSSVKLEWNTPIGITGYEIYSAQSATEPADTAYALLTSPGASDTNYTHTGLSAGNTYWYKIRAEWNPYGSGAWSRVRSFTVGGGYKAVINMSTGTLDDDFTYELKASSTTSYGHTAYGGEAPTNHKIIGMYVVNDAANLYVALDFGDKQPIGWDKDRIVVWIDNTNSSSGDADIVTMKIANKQTVTGTIESCVYLRMDKWMLGAQGTTGATVNTTEWDLGGEGSWAWGACKPVTPADLTVLKFSIPLANIGGAVEGNVLKVFAAFSEGWAENNIMWNGIIPKEAVTAGSPRTEAITVNMNSALEYTVK